MLPALLLLVLVLGHLLLLLGLVCMLCLAWCHAVSGVD
jgi:hypothetical protein